MRTHIPSMMAAALWLAGCAQTTVQTLGETTAVDLPRPPVVLVHRFGVNMDEVTANQGVLQQTVDAVQNETATERSDQVARDVADALADRLVDRINAMGLSARRGAPGEAAPRHAVIVGGYFVDIDEGNRLRRLVIGFGAGQSRIDAVVNVLQATGRGYRKLVEFDTHADSGDMPGAAVTMGAGAAAQGGLTAGMAVANAAVTGVKGYRSQADAMASRSADRAAEYLSEFFATQGWIPQRAVQQPMLP